MGSALRILFAELGFNFDEGALDRADASVEALARQLRTLIPASASGADAVSQSAERSGKKAKKAAQETTAAIDLVAEARKAAEQERAKHDAGEAFGATDEGKAHAAWKANLDARKQAEARAHATRLANLREEAEKEREAHAAKTAFGASPEGKAHALWRATADEAEAARKPITGVGDAISRVGDIASKRMGGGLAKALKLDGLLAKLGLTEQAFGKLALSVSGMAAATLGVGARTAVQFVHDFTAESEALRETARNARVTSSELQALQHAGAVSGVGAERMTQSITAFGTKLRDANNRLAGSGGTVGLLRRMGISARDSSGHIRPTVDVLSDVAVAMERISSPRQRIQVAQALGLDQRLLDVLHTGRGGIRELMSELDEYGGGVQPEATEAARKFAIAEARATLAMTSMRSVIFTSLAPVLEDLVTRGAKVVGWLSRMTRGSHMVEVALVALGLAGAAAAAPMLVAWAPAIGTFLAVAAAALATGIAIDDIVTFVKGGDSVIGHFLDQLLGVGESARVVSELRAEFGDLRDVLQTVVDLLERANQLVAPIRRLEGAALHSLVPGSSNPIANAFTSGLNRVFGGPSAEEARNQAMGRGAVRSAITIPGYQANIPALHTVTAPGSATARPNVTQHVEGDRINIHINGTDLAGMRRQVDQALEEAARRRNNRMSPRESE